MQIHTNGNRRIIQHDNFHYDIEEARAVIDESGEPVGVEWAVIYCNENEMAQAPKDASPASDPSGHIQDLSPVMEMADTTLRKEDNMNGWTPTTQLEVRIANLINQVPQEYRARSTRECYGTNDHEFERKLTGYVIMRIWETYEHPVNEAEFTDAWSDDRTDSELVDTGLNDDRPYRPGVADGDYPF